VWLCVADLNICVADLKRIAVLPVFTLCKMILILYTYCLCYSYTELLTVFMELFLTLFITSEIVMYMYRMHMVHY